MSERLDVFLVRTALARSRRAARDLIDSGAVTVNGRRALKSASVVADDRVEVTPVAAGPAIVPEPEAALEVLFSDRDALVVNKPGGVPCYPLRPGERGTMMNAVVARFPETTEAGNQPREGGLVHRLDNGTSGALLIARNRESFERLRHAIRGGEIERRYQAMVEGKVANPLELSAPVAHHAKNPRKMTLGDVKSASRKRAGRSAVSLIEPIRGVGAFTLVAVRPHTGSRHQIRVHLANAGHPIVGDELYGGPKSKSLAEGRFWLHLETIAFESCDGRKIKVRAPLPADLKKVLGER